MVILNKSIGLALLCIISWSFIPVISKIATSDITPLQLLFLSNALSSLMIGVVLILRRKQIGNIKVQLKHNIFSTIFPSFLGCFFYYLCLYYGYSKANGIAVLVVQYSWPILIVLLAPLVLREKLTRKVFVAVLIGFIGMFIVATNGELSGFDQSSLPILGIVFIGALAFAMFSLLSKKLLCHSLVSTFLFFTWATLFALIALLTSTGIRFPSSINAWLGLIVNGTIVNGLSYYWWLRALQLEHASRIAPLVFLTPILAGLWLVLFLNEPFFISHIVGLIMCVGSGMLASRA